MIGFQEPECGLCLVDSPFLLRFRILMAQNTESQPHYNSGGGGRERGEQTLLSKDMPESCTKYLRLHLLEQNLVK